MQEQQIENQEQLTAWVREQFQRANKHLAENGVLFESVVTEESRYLAPYVALWKIKATDKNYYWVMSGDLPCDIVRYSEGSTARETLRHFSYQWQMKAENIRRTDSTDKTQQDFANLLESRAEALYQIYQDDKIWAEQ